MFNVNSAEEALRVARELCARHSGIVSAGSDREARDVALRVVLAEVMAPGSSTPMGSPEALRHYERDVSPIKGGGSPQPGLTSRNLDAKSSAAVSPARSGSFSRMEACFYCTEPTSRYCKETGRRHENPEQRAKRQWRQLYRQMALASTFVSTARLSKVNTCVEEYAIDLNLDDIM